jgi:hypothetical protein
MYQSYNGGQNMTYIPHIIAVAIIVAWVLYITRDAGDHHPTMSSRFNRGWRRLVFWFGNIYLKPHAPFFDTAPPEPQMSYEEGLEALRHVKAGDVGLHREWGAFSNLAIPGFMKHAWIHTNNPVDNTKAEIIEAISEGVVKRSAMYPIMSYYTIIIRPVHATKEQVARAVSKAEKIVGFVYDADFKFDIEEELKHMDEPVDRGIEGVTRELREHDVLRTNIKSHYDGGFSCTETIAYSWWHRRKALGLYRTRARGKDVILADNILNRGWQIVWMSNL